MATWSAVRKLVGRKKRPFRPPVPTLGDDGKPFTSLQAKANQHHRELMKEFGENCAEFSEAEHLVRVQADKQAAPVRFTGSPTGACGRMLSTFSPSPSQVVRLSHSFGVDCSRRPGVPRCPRKVLRFCGREATRRPFLVSQDHSRRAIREEFCAPTVQERCMPACCEQPRCRGSPS